MKTNNKIKNTGVTVIVGILVIIAVLVGNHTINGKTLEFTNLYNAYNASNNVELIYDATNDTYEYAAMLDEVIITPEN